MDAIKGENSKAKVGTFDFNPQIPPKIKSGELDWAIDQQPFLQGYSAVDAIWLYKNNGNVLGGGKATLTGPYLVDKNNVDFVEQVRRRRHAVAARPGSRPPRLPGRPPQDWRSS